MMDEADKEAQRAFITGIRGEVSEGEEPEQAATAKPGETGWVVRILDQSGASAGDDDVVEEVKGFLDLAHANAFARAYVRDSIERCRIPGAAER
ncbi:MAG: hypothetical protein M3036_10015, partial [Bifidobacteriales bacterium]|nr:hypothetical protein [Bifidobacteriales bacterium]